MVHNVHMCTLRTRALVVMMHRVHRWSWCTACTGTAPNSGLTSLRSYNSRNRFVVVLFILKDSWIDPSFMHPSFFILFPIYFECYLRNCAGITLLSVQRPDERRILREFVPETIFLVTRDLLMTFLRLARDTISWCLLNYHNNCRRILNFKFRTVINNKPFWFLMFLIIMSRFGAETFIFWYVCLPDIIDILKNSAKI